MLCVRELREVYVGRELRVRVSVGAVRIIANAVDYVAEFVEVVRRGYEIGRIRCAFALKFG